MSRAARIAGWTVFLMGLLGVGMIAFGLLTIRSPLGDGTTAAGPEREAYWIAAAAVAAGSMIAGVMAAGVTEGIVRLWRHLRG